MLQETRTFGNRILDALPSDDMSRLAPDLRRVFLHREQVIGRPHEPVNFLHFPVDAFCWSWSETTDTERPTAILTVGNRGLLELDRALGIQNGRSCVTVVSPGTAWQLPADVLDRHAPCVDDPLRRLIERYAYACVLNGAARLACNSEHNVDQRLARWLLWVADESGHTEFSITHRQIAEIAAIRRPSVSLALSQMQRKGIVRSRHGRLQILDRERLEKLVCGCYWIIRQNADGISTMIS